jgi:hypothetical protein
MVKNKTKKHLRKMKTGGSKIEKLNCSPATTLKKRVKQDSCFTPDLLMKILQKYNEKHPENPIKEKTPKKIWLELKNRLDCNKEECWLSLIEDEKIREKIKKYIFAPKHPTEWVSNPNEWLSNYDILEVAKQYEISHPEFKMIGPTTIDFDTRLEEYDGKCVLEDLCKFSLDRFIRTKKTKIGIVFNLDKHYQSGSHWVSMFIDIPNRFILFFDSANNEIPPEIWKDEKTLKKGEPVPLVNRIIQQGSQLDHPIHFKFYNNRNITHQRGNTECGMYSLYFIITMLTGKTKSNRILSVKERIRMFLKKRIPDNLVFEYRKIYFNGV